MGAPAAEAPAAPAAGTTKTRTRRDQRELMRRVIDEMLPCRSGSSRRAPQCKREPAATDQVGRHSLSLP